MCLNHVERFRALMSFGEYDRLPTVEWAPWWDKTLARWHGEGLPQELIEAEVIRDYLGLDNYRQSWIRPIGPGAPEPVGPRAATAAFAVRGPPHRGRGAHGRVS